MKNKSLIIIIAALVVIIAAAAIAYPSLSQKAMEEQTAQTTEAPEENKENSEAGKDVQSIPDVKLFDTQGNEVKLSDFAGKPVILNFWASWCGYCVKEMPDFQAAYEEYGDEIQFLVVNTDDGIEAGEKFLKDKGYTFPSYYDLEHSAAITYAITGLPRTIAIAKDGTVKYNRAGMIDSATLESIIASVK